MIFDKNRDLLAKRFPFLREELAGPMDGIIKLETELSKTGLPVAKVYRGDRKVYLNSPYDPELDARRWASNQSISETGSLLVCGGGFLYHLKALLERDNFQKIIVYEPCAAIFKACMQAIDLAPFLASQKLLLLTGADYDQCIQEMTKFLGMDFLFSKTNIQMVVLPSYKEVFKAEINLFQAKFSEAIKLTHTNLATTDVYREQWLLNEFKNLNTVGSSPVIRHFFGQFKEIPAIIVSAGPSLEKNIHLLKDIKEKALIICAGSSIRAMKRNEVTPHFLVAFDPSEVNTRVYNDLELDDIYFLFNLHFYHGVISHFNGKKVIYQTNTERFPELFKNSFGYEFGIVQSGFSCAHTCLDVALQLGCDPIILIGQDLAYTGDKRYAEGQMTTHQKYLEKNQLPPNCFITKDIYGRDIVTDRELDGFRIVFEKLLQQENFHHTHVINATEGGQPIAGTVNRKLADVLAEYCCQDREISGRIAQIYERGLKDLRYHKIEINSFVMKLKKLVEKGIVKLDELIDRLQRLRKLNFNTDTEFKDLEALLDKIAAEYDQSLNYTEYHILLKELQETRLSVNKYRAADVKGIQSKEAYDERLQNYLIILVETKKGLEYVKKCIQETFKLSANELITGDLPVNIDEIEQLEREIKHGGDLKKIQHTIESVLRNPNSASVRSYYLYLYGILHSRKKSNEQAISFLEEAISLNGSLAKGYLELAKLYYKKQNYSTAINHINVCQKFNFKPSYCTKTLLKICYLSQDYVAVNNLLPDYQKARTSSRLLIALRIDCLSRLGLNTEANKEYRLLSVEYKPHYKLNQWVQSRLPKETVTDYERKYELNLKFFQQHQLSLREFTEIRYKVCRFLSGELIYDGIAKKFFPWSKPSQPCDLKIWLGDVVTIYNPDNIAVFERLQLTYNEIASDQVREEFGNIPIFIFESDPEHWSLLLQLYDFNLLKDWGNLHFHIGLTESEVQKVFTEEATPFPNIFYGTHPEQFEKLLLDAKQLKDAVYKRRMQEILDYYRTKANGDLSKVMLVFNLKNDISRFYAQILTEFLSQNGIEYRTYHEDPRFIKFTPYSTAKVIAEYRPDLILALMVVQEEIEVINELPVPFTGWLLTDKSLDNICRMDRIDQRLFITGNLKVQNEIVAKGYPLSRIRNISLPVVFKESKNIIVEVNDIGIVTDLIDFDETLKSLEIIIYGVLTASSLRVSQADIAIILRTLYFKIHNMYTNQDQISAETGWYENAVQDVFTQQGVLINRDSVQLIAVLLKKELEASFAKMVQARWLIDNMQEYRTVFYGAGWEKIANFKSDYQAGVNFFNDPAGYQKLILQNKINLYIGSLILNNSYLQPDLLWGIAAGGFYLVNNLWVKKFGEEVLQPFGGLLETYNGKEELVAKIRYFIENNAERITRAQKLQAYIIDNLKIENVISALLSQ